MKNFLLSVKFKKVFALFLAIIICLTCFLLSGCEEEDFQDPENPTQQSTFFEKYVGGFNTVFANDLTGSGGIEEGQDKINILQLTTLGAFLYFYGNGNETSLNNENAPELKNLLNFNTNAPFPDSIRMLVTAENGNGNLNPIANTNKHWNWFIDPNANYPTTNILNPETSPDEGINNVDYQTWKNNAISLMEGNNSYSFPDYMQDIFQVVLYEIMLGIEPTEIEISYENVTNFFYTDHGGSYTIDSGKLYTVKISSSSTLTNISDNVIYQIIYNDNSSALIKNITIVDYEDKIKPKVLESLDKLQEKYLSNSRYIGLTKENADKLISYILNEMIGTDLVAYDYNTYRGQTVNYRNYVATIANLIYVQTYDGSGDNWEYVFENNQTKISFVFEGTDNEGIKDQGSFAAKPATYVRYYPGETLFGEFGVEYQFDGVPVGEYQSILIVPAKTPTTIPENGIKLESGFVFNFMTRNKDLKINTKVRYHYYNEKTGYRKLFEFDCNQVNFDDGYQGTAPDGSTYWENDFDFSVDTNKLPEDLVQQEIDSTGYRTKTYTIGFFNNAELLNKTASGEISLANPSVSDIQDLYKVIPSQNGFGGITVLNEKKMNCSFFEIVLDVVKSPTDPENTDYNFALVLSNTILTPGIW